MRAETGAAVETGRDAPATALEILGVAAHEAIISRLFGELIEHGGAAGHVLLAALVGRPIDPSARLQVRLEAPFDGLGGELRRIDLVVSWHEKQRACLLVVEHRLFASESVNPAADLVAARSQFERWALDAAPHASDATADVTMVQLTLPGDAATPEGWRQVVHAELVEPLRAFAVADARGRLAHEWAALVERFIRGSALQWDGTLAGHFAVAPAGLDARHARFEAFTGEVARRAGAEMHGAYRASAQGRSWFGAYLTWPGLYSPESPRSGLPVDLRRDWWVALQIRLHLPPAPLELSLSLFCETLPYVTRSQFGKLRIAELERASYRATRAVLAEQLKSWKRDGLQPWDRWRPNGEWCQLATLDRRCDEATTLTLAADGMAAEIAAVRTTLEQRVLPLRS